MQRWTMRSLTGAAAAMVIVTSLVGCGMLPSVSVTEQDQSSEESLTAQSDALERYAAAERKTMPEVLAANPGVYSEASVEASPPSMIVYSYTYLNQVDGLATAAFFDTAIPEFQSALDSSVFPAMASMGVTGTLRATYIYYNADGSLVWQYTFTQS